MSRDCIGLAAGEVMVPTRPKDGQILGVQAFWTVRTEETGPELYSAIYILGLDSGDFEVQSGQMPRLESASRVYLRRPPHRLELGRWLLRLLWSESRLPTLAWSVAAALRLLPSSLGLVG
jgi:hypothetical protein